MKYLIHFFVLFILFFTSCEKTEVVSLSKDAIDIRSSHKILICHKTGNINNPCKVIEISKSALQTHLDHGDYIPFDLFLDFDGDGFGGEKIPEKGCEVPPGYSANGGDCDDTDPAINPDAEEICDGKDNDCDGLIDEDLDCGGTGG